MDNDSETPKTALERAISALGSQTALASAIGGSVKTGHIYYWMKAGVPAEHCPAIERETRRVAAERGDPLLSVTCEELCPSVPWDVLREQVTA
jgi:DNA-binding transcriptional regulator YdaS (Cro superfamily)